VEGRGANGRDARKGRFSLVWKPYEFGSLRDFPSCEEGRKGRPSEKRFWQSKSRNSNIVEKRSVELSPPNHRNLQAPRRSSITIYMRRYYFDLRKGRGTTGHLPFQRIDCTNKKEVSGKPLE